MAALPAISMLPRPSFGDGPATATVNTTGLAVTDTEVTVGILHSATGTMAISETGSIQAEKLAIEQINAAGGVLAARSSSSRKTAPATGRPSPRRRRSFWSTTRSPPSSAAGPRPRARRCCRSSSSTTACSITRPSTKASSSPRTSSTPARKPPSRSSPASTGSPRTKSAKTFYLHRLRLHLAAHLQQDRAQAHRERSARCKVVGEEYFPLGHTQFDSVINKIKLTKPDVIYADHRRRLNVSFYKQLKAAGVDLRSRRC